MNIGDFGDRFNEKIMYNRLICLSDCLLHNILDERVWIPSAVDHVNQTISCMIAAAVETPYLQTTCFIQHDNFSKIVMKMVDNVDNLIESVETLISKIKTTIRSFNACEDYAYSNNLYDSWDYLIEQSKKMLSEARKKWE